MGKDEDIRFLPRVRWRSVYSSGYGLRELFLKRKYGFKREELVCTNQNRFKREFLLLPRFSLKSNHLETTWTHTSHTDCVQADRSRG